MPEQFVAVDVETANRDRHSICQIGLAAFANGLVEWEWSSYINPECDFDGANIKVHGIGSHHVRGAPKWPSALATIANSIEGQVIVSHTPFDCDAIHHAAQRYDLKLPSIIWLDTHAVAKMVWPELYRHDLQTLCGRLSIALTHHDAASDARACGLILSWAIQSSGIGLHDWIRRVGAVTPAPYALRTTPTPKRYSERIEAAGNPDGPLAGHVWVCTGDFELGEAALVEMATSLGCDVKENVTRKTTMLVVGKRDPSRFDGKEKSRKQLAAEAAIADGRKVSIMNEREFIELAKYYRRDRALA